VGSVIRVNRRALAHDAMTRRILMSSPRGTLELNNEYPPPGESAEIEKVVEGIKTLLEKQEGRFRRDQHAKDTGCVKAEFVVEPDLPEEFRYGVLKTPRTYQAVIRFSNGDFKVNRDSEPDARGMAVKLLEVEGPKLLEGEENDPSQDFLMINYPVFAHHNVKGYGLSTSFKRRLGQKAGRMLFFLLPWNWGLAKIGKATQNQPVSSPLEAQYWSLSPSMLGPRAIKFSVKPQPVNIDFGPPRQYRDEVEPGFLFQALADHLKGREARFDFMVQFQKDPERMPIEDTAVRWEESQSPFLKVATIRVPSQDLRSAEMVQFRASCEDLSFNPWHSLPDHRPVGGINRVRKAVYQAIANLRREKNREMGH
jgi:hypothetical protein